MRRFVVIQPGCDMQAADVFEVEYEEGTFEDPTVRYVLERGVEREFLNDAEIGDVCFFDRERVIMRVGRKYNTAEDKWEA